MDDYDATLNWARDNSVTIYHPTGTCKMGQDDMAVVDARLKVRGIKGSARRRLLHHAHDHLWQHQCSGDHDW